MDELRAHRAANLNLARPLRVWRSVDDNLFELTGVNWVGPVQLNAFQSCRRSKVLWVRHTPETISDNATG